jgi:hypothetical protein
MSMHSPTDAEAFLNFYVHSLDHGGRELPPEEIVRKWRAERELEKSCGAIMEGWADIQAGRCRPFEEFDLEFRQRNGLPPRVPE